MSIIPEYIGWRTKWYKPEVTWYPPDMGSVVVVKFLFRLISEIITIKIPPNKKKKPRYLTKQGIFNGILKGQNIKKQSRPVCIRAHAIVFRNLMGFIGLVFFCFCSWKSCHFKNPSRRAAHLAQQVNKKLHFFPRYGVTRFLLQFLQNLSNAYPPAWT